MSGVPQDDCDLCVAEHETDYGRVIAFFARANIASRPDGSCDLVTAHATYRFDTRGQLATIIPSSLQALAEVARDAALARERAAFDVKWADFWKCSRCGGRVELLPDRIQTPICHGWHDIIRTGYARVR